MKIGQQHVRGFRLIRRIQEDIGAAGARNQLAVRINAAFQHPHGGCTYRQNFMSGIMYGINHCNSGFGQQKIFMVHFMLCRIFHGNRFEGAGADMQGYLRLFYASGAQRIHDFAKTGSDATTLATRIARSFTGKAKIIRCGYHGWHDWCVENKGGVLPKAYADTLEFEYNDLQGLEDLLKEHASEVAGIIITPLGHPNAHEVEMPKPGFLEGVKKLAEQYGSVLIFDEIRTGFRVSLGGAQKLFGVTPHMSVFGKAMANGYEISMVAGRRDIMDVLISKAFVSSTYFNNTLAMAASLKTIELLERDNMLEVIARRGHAFCRKVRKYVKASGVPCTFTGEPWMPYITFDKDDTGAYKKTRVNFYTQLIRRKVFLQPYHHGYVCYRHSAKDLNYAADMIAESLEEVRKAA